MRIQEQRFKDEDDQALSDTQVSSRVVTNQEGYALSRKRAFSIDPSSVQQPHEKSSNKYMQLMQPAYQDVLQKLERRITRLNNLPTKLKNGSGSILKAPELKVFKKDKDKKEKVNFDDKAYGCLAKANAAK